MSDIIIRVQELKKVYKVGSENVVALDNISFEVPKGQILCIVGTSGSGKSTLLNQLAGLERPTHGSVYLGKRNISKLSENALARFRQNHVGFIFQSYNLLTYLTALENVALPLVFKGIEQRKRDQIARKYLHEVGLSSRLHHTPNQMSGGQQQRVGIARAFVVSPKILFADEPSGNLDSKTTIDVMRMMVRLCREKNQTLVLVTHDNNLARYADRIITIIDGNIVGDKPNISLADSQTYEEAIFEAEEKLRLAEEEYKEHLEAEVKKEPMRKAEINLENQEEKEGVDNG